MSKDLHIKVSALPAAYWFTIGVATLFTLMVFLAFLQNMNIAGPREYFMLLLGFAGLFLIFRMIRYFTKPNLSITAQALIYRPFWRPTVAISFDEVDHFDYRYEKVPPKNHMRYMKVQNEGELITIHKLDAILTSGKQIDIVLPVFSDFTTDDILQKLISASGRLVKRS